jgi:orotate phosphoribosyltransferase
MFSNTFPDKAFVAETVASMLLEIKAVHFNATEPYKLVFGHDEPGLY